MTQRRKPKKTPIKRRNHRTIYGTAVFLTSNGRKTSPQDTFQVSADFDTSPFLYQTLSSSYATTVVTFTIPSTTWVDLLYVQRNGGVRVTKASISSQSMANFSGRPEETLGSYQGFYYEVYGYGLTGTFYLEAGNTNSTGRVDFQLAAPTCHVNQNGEVISPPDLASKELVVSRVVPGGG